MHFSVLVIGGFVDEQLEPYSVEPDSEFMEQEWVDVSDDEDCYSNPEYLVEAYQSTDGTYYSPYTNEGYKLKQTDAILHKVPLKTIYPTLKDYMEECGYEFNEDEGSYGYWSNPNAKWDWFEIGGRWQNVFVLKEGAEGYKGTCIIPEESPDVSEVQYTAQASKKDIDWDTTYKLQRQKQEDLWNIMDNKKEKEWQIWLSKGKTKKEYIDTYSWLPIHSILKDGEWIDSEEDFWFTGDTDEEEYVKWGKYVQSVIDQCDDEELLTIVDCHM